MAQEPFASWVAPATTHCAQGSPSLWDGYRDAERQATTDLKKDAKHVNTNINTTAGDTTEIVLQLR